MHQRSKGYRHSALRGAKFGIPELTILPPEVGLRTGEPVTTFYETLEVSPRASNSVIRAAYRCLAQHHHPDKNPDANEASQRLVSINEAYAVLSDASKRMAYDHGLRLNGGSQERRGFGNTRHLKRQPGEESAPSSRPFVFRPLESTTITERRYRSSSEAAAAAYRF